MTLTLRTRTAILIVATAGLLFGIALGSAQPTRAEDGPSAQPAQTSPLTPRHRGSRSGPKPWSKLSIPTTLPAEDILQSPPVEEGIQQFNDGVQKIRDLLPWG